MHFSRELQRLIDAKGWTQTAFADQVGLSGPAINMICKGTRTPPLESINLWCTALGLKGIAAVKFKHLAHLAHGTEETADTISAMAHQLAALGVHAFDHLAVGEPLPMQVHEESVSYDTGTHRGTVPLVGTAAAGKPTEAAVWQAMTDFEHVPIPDHWLLIKVTGGSAYPIAYPGQLVWVDQLRAVKPSTMNEDSIIDLHNNICLVQTIEDDGPKAYIKRLCSDARAPGGFLFASIDSGRGSPFLPLEIIELIMPIVGVWFEDPRLPRLKGRNRAEVTITV